MAVYRCISQEFWSDTKVSDDFTPEDKYFYLYLLTNPYTTISGCYELSLRKAGQDLGYNVDTVERLIDRMERIHGVVKYNKPTKEVLLVNWCKYNWSKSPKLQKAVETSLKSIKCDDFRRYVSDRVSIGYPYTMDTTVSVSVSVSVSDSVSDSGDDAQDEREGADTEDEKPEQAKRSRFTAPSLDEVKAFFTEKGSTDQQAERFFDYYESNGWMVGKNKMKKWKAAASGWISRDKQQANKPRNKAFMASRPVEEAHDWLKDAPKRRQLKKKTGHERIKRHQPVGNAPVKRFLSSAMKLHYKAENVLKRHFNRNGKGGCVCFRQKSVLESTR